MADTIQHSVPGGVITVFIVDGDLYLRTNLPPLLAQFREVQITGVFSDGEEAVKATKTHPPNAVLMDIKMPCVSGAEAVRLIRQHSPETRVLALTSFSEPTMLARMQAVGASGCLLKDTPVLGMFRAIAAADAGLAVASPETLATPPSNTLHLPPNLTDNETKILTGICQGLTNAQIAARVSLAPSTVKHHISLLMERMGAANRTMLAIHTAPLLRLTR